MDLKLKEELSKIALTIRKLSIEAVEKANSGHPGLPMGCAEIGAYLYGVALEHNPKHSHWINRDRFVLSAGHGSMLLYSCLHLAGFNVSLEDIKNFRQLDSLTPGHPEFGTDGVETTSGPLGQGIGNAIGMALGFQILKKKFNTSDFEIFNNKVYCLLSDGCMMEGAASEASSLAGHFGLDNLIVIWDSNNVCLDGPLSECFSEDVKARYRAYGFDVFEIDGHDFDAIDNVIQNLKKEQTRPAFIQAHTIIGRGSPHKAGSHKVHGSPLGKEELELTKQALHLPSQDFYISNEVKEIFSKKQKEQETLEKMWIEKFEKWKKTYPELYKDFEKMKNKTIEEDLEKTLQNIEIPKKISGRKASHIIINKLAEIHPFIYGGSADLSSSDMTYLENFSMITKGHFQGRNIKFGVREFAMATISTGLYLTGMITPFIGTFLVFSDYLKNGLRLACLSSFHVIYQFTHDSIFLGEDGPTHQPIEHLAALRAIPNLLVIRPGSSKEVKLAWITALKNKGPTAIVLSRQEMGEVEDFELSEKTFLKGAYIAKENLKPDFTLFATGSELSLAFDVAKDLEEKGFSMRVVSFPCFELFDKQDKKYKDSILQNAGIKVSIEAATSFGWHKYIGENGVAISLESFGLSAPKNDLAKEFGFTKEQIVQKLLSVQHKN